MPCKRACCFAAFEAVDKIGWVAYDCIEQLFRGVFKNVGTYDFNSVAPWATVDVPFCLFGCVAVNLGPSYTGVAALCSHNGYQSASSSNVKDAPAA